MPFLLEFLAKTVLQLWQCRSFVIKKSQPYFYTFLYAFNTSSKFVNKKLIWNIFFFTILKINLLKTLNLQRRQTEMHDFSPPPPPSPTSHPRIRKLAKPQNRRCVQRRRVRSKGDLALYKICRLQKSRLFHFCFLNSLPVFSLFSFFSQKADLIESNQK